MGNALSNLLLRRGLDRVQPLQQTKNKKSSRLANRNFVACEKNWRVQCRSEAFHKNAALKDNTLKESEEREFVWKNHLYCNEKIIDFLHDRIMNFTDDVDDKNLLNEEKIDY